MEGGGVLSSVRKHFSSSSPSSLSPPLHSFPLPLNVCIESPEEEIRNRRRRRTETEIKDGGKWGLGRCKGCASSALERGNRSRCRKTEEKEDVGSGFAFALSPRRLISRVYDFPEAPFRSTLFFIEINLTYPGSVSRGLGMGCAVIAFTTSYFSLKLIFFCT